MNKLSHHLENKLEKRGILRDVTETKFIFDDGISKKLEKIQFSIFSPEEMQKQSVVDVKFPDMYSGTIGEVKVPNGVVDPRMGSGNEKCGTCGMPHQHCQGHFGFIKLELPCFHVGYFNKTYDILSKICKRCSKILLATDQKQKLLELIRKKKKPLEYGFKKIQSQNLGKKTKKNTICPHCGEYNGKIKKIDKLRIIHEWYVPKESKNDDYEEKKTKI